eukprot:452613-Hanusia_phi.AAC.3
MVAGELPEEGLDGEGRGAQGRREAEEEGWKEFDCGVFPPPSQPPQHHLHVEVITYPTTDRFLNV